MSVSSTPPAREESPDDGASASRARGENSIGQHAPVSESRLKNRLHSDAFYVVVCRVVGIAATMAGHMLASRWLGPEEYGQFVLMTTVIAFGSVFAMKGLNEAGLRFIAESLAQDRPRLAQSFLRRIGWSLLVNSLVAMCLFAVGMFLFHTFVRSLQEPFWLIAFTSGGIMLLAWQQVAAESLRGYGQLGRASLYSGGQAGGPISNLLFLALFGMSALCFSQIRLWWALLLAVVSILLTIPFALQSIRTTSQKHLRVNRQPVNEVAVADLEQLDVSVNAEQVRKMNRVGVVLMLNQILAFGTYQFDIWLGGVFLEGPELGLYSAAKRALLLVALPLQMAMMTVLPVVPRMRAQNRMADLERFLRSTATYAAIPSFMALLALLLFPELILQITFGRDYVAAAPIALVMCIGHLVMIVTGNPPYILAMTGRQRSVVVVNLVAALLMAIFGTLGALKFGGVGLAIGCSASLIAQHGLLWWVARSKLGIWTHLGRPIWPSRTDADGDS